MVQLAGDEVDFGKDEDVVAPGVVDAVEVLPSSEDKVQLVPMLRSWVAPRDLVPSLILEESVGDGQLVEEHSSRSLCPFSFILPTPRRPSEVGQALWSAPTRALKSPSM